MSEESTEKRKHDIILEIVFSSIPGPPERQQYNDILQYLQSLRWLYFQNQEQTRWIKLSGAAKEVN